MHRRKFLKTLLQRNSYYQRLVMSHLLVLFVTISIMAGFNYAFSRDQQSQRMLEMLGHSGLQTASSIEARFAQMQNVSELLRYTLHQMLLESFGKAPQPQLDASTINTIRTLRDSFNFKDVSAWLPPGYFSSGEGITFFDISQPGGRPQRPQVLNAPYNKLCWMALNDYAYPFMRFSSYERFNLITCFMRVSTLSESGSFCFFIDINERELAALLDKPDATPIEQYIVDEAGQILAHPDSARLRQALEPELMDALKSANGTQPIWHENTAFLTYPLATTDWKLLVSVPGDYLSAISLTSSNGLFVAVAIAAAVAVLVSLIISRQLMSKLLMMSGVIRSIEPTFRPSGESFARITAKMPVPADGAPPDVLDELALVFNKLVDRLNDSMQSALDSSLAQEKLRYPLLRAKINPHFLYNILDSIKICNSLGRRDDANLLLSRLAAFYRLILRKNDLDIITIGEELEIVRLYLEMEAISHEHAFSFTLKADPDVELFSIPRFVLQPLVENCVIHGLPGDAKHMTIIICLSYKGDAICIEIRDDGLGMSEDMMAKLMRVVHGEEELPKGDSSTKFYGLMNVSARLKPYVMDASEPIHYTSRQGEGTSVLINLKQLLPDEPEAHPDEEVHDV
jgi:two-component system sensor histidine kinase YesM